MFGCGDGLRLGVPNMGNGTVSVMEPSGAVGVAAPVGAWELPISLACTRRSAPVRPSPRTKIIHLRFGVPPGGQSVSIAADASIRLSAGRIILLTGPSGSGKSSALSVIEDKRVSINVQRIEFSEDCAIIDEVSPHGELAEAATILTACGLGDASLWLRPYAALSEGEKFRGRLARAISLEPTGIASPPPPSRRWDEDMPPPLLRGGEGDRRGSPNGGSLDTPSLIPLICDEFCSGLHRRAAKAIAHNLRKLVTRRGLCIVVACSTDDVTADLDPDTVVRFAPSGICQVSERTPSANPAPSLRRKLRIEPGLKRDYENFAAMHYRGTDELGFVDRVFVLREGGGGDALGIVVYSHPALELSLRNKATNGWFSRNPQRVNKHLRILRRLVIHPDVRGCGLGHYLVRKTMPLLGTDYVECLAAMGEFNPVFERAGMVRVGQYDAPLGPKAALQALRSMDVDPQSTEFAIDVARRPAVRKVVAQAVADWYAATTAGGENRAERQSPETLARTFRGLIGVRPVYYLWRRPDSTPRAQRTFQNEAKVKRGKKSCNDHQAPKVRNIAAQGEALGISRPGDQSPERAK